MRRVTCWVRRSLRHTRIVPSGSPPLYRLLLVGTVLSGVAQAFDREATLSVAALTPWWVDWLFIGFTLLSGLCALAGLYLIDEHKFHATKLAASLQLERFGLSTLMTVVAVNQAAVVFYYDQLPTSGGSWFQIMFWCWAWTRLWEIHKALRELTR